MLPPALLRPLVVGVSLVCVLVLVLATLRPTAEEEGAGTRRAVTRRLQSITQYFDTYSHIINLDTFISLSFTQGTLILYLCFLKFNVPGFLIEHHENSQIVTIMMKKIFDILSRGKSKIFFYISRK